MYIYDGFKYSEEEIKNAADKAGLSIEDYISKNAIAIEDEPQDFPTSTVEDADAVQQPMTASQAGFTESPSVDIPSDSQEDDEVTLEEYKSMTVAEKKKLSYSDRQRLPRELYREKNNILDEIESEASKKFKSGALRVGSNLAQIPAFINRLKMTTAMGIAGSAFEEEVEKFKELDPATQDRIAQAIGSFSGGPIGNIGMAGSAGLEAAENLKNDAKKIEETLTKYDNTIGQDFIQGNISQAVSRTFNEVIGTIPSIAQAFVPYVGISSIVAGSAADYSTEALAEGKKLDAANMIAATATGFSEGLLELTTKKIGKGLFKSLAGKSKNVVSKTLKEAALQTAKEAGQEGLSESTTEVLNRSIDALYKNKGDEWDNIWPELADVFIIGAAAGGGMSGSGNTASVINKAVQVNSVNRTLKENNSQSVLDSFEKDPISKETINIAKNKYSGNILDIELKDKVSNGDISLEESKSIKQKFNITRKNIQLTSDLKINENLAQETIGLLDERESLSSEIAKAKGNKSLVETQQSRLNDIDSRLSEISAENKLSITTKTVEKLAKDVKGLTVKNLDNADAIVDFIEKNNIDVDSKKASNQQGFIYQNPKTGDQTIIINKEVAGKEFAVNVAAHEFLHGLLFQTVKNSPETQIALGKSLNDYINNIDAAQIKDSNFAKRLEDYKDMDEATQSEEVLTLFSDAIATGDIQFNENVFTKIGDVIRRALQNLGVKVKFNSGKDVYNFVKDYNKSIEKGKLTKAQKAITEKQAKGKLVKEKIDSEVKTDIKASKSLELQEQLDNLDEFDFDNEVDFQTAKTNLETKIRLAKKKELSKPTEEAKPKDKTKDDTKKNEKRIGDQLKAMVPPGTTNKDFKEKVAIKVIDNIDNGMLNPLIKKIAAGYGVVADNVYGKSWDDFFIEVAGVQLKKNIMAFNPESNNDLGGYIIGSQYGVRNRVKEALAKFKKEGEGGFKEDVSVAKNVIAREDAAPQEAEKRKYTPLTKSNVVPNFTITAITDKLTKVLSSLESKITDKRGDNSATTPLIAEIKKKIGKVVGDPEAAPKIVIQRLGKLKDGTYEKNLIKNKKAIIENMTTTFLMGKDSGKKVSGGIPQAIEKSVGGKFTGKKVTVNVGGKEIVQEEFAPNFVPYPEWVGQKIDREKTLVRGATAGNEIVRRVPANKVSDADFVGLFIDEKGKLIRGKREALGKAIAEEMAFEIFTKEIKNENSAISKAFEGNQEAKGVILADNFVNEVIKDADRGTVKFSMSAKSKSNIRGLLNSEIKNIKANNPKYNASIEYILNQNLLQKLDKIKTIEDLLKTLYSETIYTYGSTNIANRARIKILNLIARNTGNTISSEEIFNTFQKAVTRDLWKYEKQVIGFEYSLDNLKNNIEKGNRVKAIKDWFRNDSRVIRTQKIQNITRNLDAFNYLKSKGIALDGFEVTFNDNKTRSYIEYKGERLFNLTDVTDIKKNFELKADVINKEAQESVNYMFDTIKEGVKNGNTAAINGWIALMYEDQRGPIRKSSKIGKFVKNYKELKVADLILEHETEAYSIYKAYQNLANNYSEAKVKETKSFLDKAYVNLVDKKIDADLKAAKEEGLNDKERYRKTDKEYNLKSTKLSKSIQVLDPKGKVYKPSTKFSKTMNSTFNKMLERKTGIAADETISKVIARRRGVKKGKFKLFMPSSLDDFKGLTSYTFAGKGKQGEADQKFFQDTLIDPYFKGIRAIEETRQSFKDDFKALNKQMRPVIKKLGKLVPGTEFTHDQAIRVALWNASGYEIPGLSEIDQKKLVDYVNDNADLSEYARKLQQISKRPKWAKPGDFWDAETILSDLNNLTEKIGRKEFLSEFIENADIIFSEDNLNKVEAGYGKATRDALEDILYRMKNGTNRPSSTTDNTNRFNTWINNSIGAIMFFNRRSALLQTLSTVNFINWSDNNPLKAAIAFANQKQYWSDFATLFNSPKLKQRRSGLKSDVNEAEIARAVKGSKNKAVAALSYLLKIGFTPTQMADSFAIASGGATFYRNRIKSYLKKVNEEGEALYTKEQAEEMAFKDFSQISEETQQSGDPALISSDQASIVGRVLLAFQNTPIQLNRSIKKAALDIKNRRRTPGQTMLQSDFSNLSKIIYYGTVQNIIFSALQNALFALIPGFEEEDDELTEEEQLEKYGKVYSTKQSRIIQGMIDTTLKGGFGLPGAFISTLKNAYVEYDKQEQKEFMADQTYTILSLANLSPSVGSKLRKVYSAIQTKKFEKDVIEKRDWDITIDGKFNLSPSYKVLGSLTEGFTNLPLDRAVTEVNALTEALDYRNTVWQRVALALGWRSWDVGAENEEHELIKTEAKAKRKEEGKEKAKATRAKTKKEKAEKARLERIEKLKRMSK